MPLNDNDNITLLHGHTDELPRQMRVLILEDSAIDQELIRRAASKSNLELNFEFAETLTRFAEVIRSKTFDLAILDFQLPDGTGLEALRLISKPGLNDQCATIMIASEANISVAITALKAGCSDFIIKEDLTPATIRRAVLNAMQKTVLRQKVTQASKKLATLRGALREHAELSSSIMRPMLDKTLSQVSAVDFVLRQSGQPASEMRLGMIAENCRLISRLCESIEQDADLANDGQNILD